MLTACVFVISTDNKSAFYIKIYTDVNDILLPVCTTRTQNLSHKNSRIYINALI